MRAAVEVLGCTPVLERGIRDLPAAWALRIEGGLATSVEHFDDVTEACARPRSSTAHSYTPISVSVSKSPVWGIARRVSVSLSAGM